MTFSLQLSTSARSELLLRQSKIETGYLALRLSAAGCNGWTFSFEHVPTPLLSDTFHVEHGIRIGIDKEHLVLLDKLSIDFMKSQFQNKFLFMSPLETHRCGCGESVKLSKPKEIGEDSLMAY